MMLPASPPPRHPPFTGGPAHNAVQRGWTALRALFFALLLGSGLLLGATARADGLEMLRAAVQRTPDGVMLDLETRIDLPPGVEAALQKGVALHFVAEADLLRERWYWRDERVSQALRTWRIAYQPLTLQYRVNLGGLSQTVGSLSEALRLAQRNLQWRVADPIAPNDNSNYQLEVTYKLDLNQLPRPLLIGLGGQSEWKLEVTRTIPVPAPNGSTTTSR